MTCKLKIKITTKEKRNKINITENAKENVKVALSSLPEDLVVPCLHSTFGVQDLVGRESF